KHSRLSSLPAATPYCTAALSAKLSVLCASALSLLFSLYFVTSRLHYFSSVMPLLRILSSRVLLHMLRHPLHQIRRSSRLPPMPLHRPPVLKIAIARWVLQPFHRLFQLIHRQIQIKIVHVAHIHVNLPAQLRPERRPVRSNVVAEVVPVVA